MNQTSHHRHSHHRSCSHKKNIFLINFTDIIQHTILIQQLKEFTIRSQRLDYGSGKTSSQGNRFRNIYHLQSHHLCSISLLKKSDIIDHSKEKNDTKSIQSKRKTDTFGGRELHVTKNTNINLRLPSLRLLRSRRPVPVTIGRTTKQSSDYLKEQSPVYSYTGPTLHIIFINKRYCCTLLNTVSMNNYSAFFMVFIFSTILVNCACVIFPSIGVPLWAATKAA